ncbi:MAG: ATP-grasp domain-containing protein [Myxococcales bacterium FL481]|nr:MAG: ATP-grasp domain-containing protein [Myxococcales bacterium FL481]
MSSNDTHATPSPEIAAAMGRLVTPLAGYVGCNEALAVIAGIPGARLGDLRSLPLRELGHRLVALRYVIANREQWLRYFVWEPNIARVDADAPARVRALAARIDRAMTQLAELEVQRRVKRMAPEELAERIVAGLEDGDTPLDEIVALTIDEPLRLRTFERLRQSAARLVSEDPRAADVLYLATYDLRGLPATTVGEGALRYLIVADKGEMGVRAVREAAAFGATPVVLYSERDDDGALQVRLAEAAGGFSIALAGSFRESYANFLQVTERVLAAYEARFGEDARAELARSAIYPGYGPLAENAAAIAHFRRHGIVFVGPTQDTVLRAGDKRRFRLLAQSFDEQSVTPGIVIDHEDPEAVLDAVLAGYKAGRFAFPGRLKAANGGGGRGQAIVDAPSGVPAAVHKVLSEIEANGWDPGVMFEQNIADTIHLEVQVVRDRFGNTRHFGMRDCSEQRASQKIQEEAPPAILRDDPGLESSICQLAVRIADTVGYVGACTVELMFKDGRYYLLEMNTRIQVEHPVSEETHRIRTTRGDEPVDLVALQFHVAAGRPILFAQEDVVCTHVGREFRINAESWRPDVKDSRDGKCGLFLPNAGVFDRIEVPAAEDVLVALRAAGLAGIADLGVRFDCGFSEGDTLVNKDPTFGKLIVSVATTPEQHDRRFELLRLASIAVLREVAIEGRQVTPDGKIVRGSTFETNVSDHVRVLESECLRAHVTATGAPQRHVNWLVDALRAETVSPSAP